jgi:outer membrane protein assembly factor BamB
MCCPDFEGDRTKDSDCVGDVLLKGELSTPAMLGSNMVVSANVLENDKALVVLYLLGSRLEVLQKIEVGRWDKALPVVVSKALLGYVGHSGGVKAFAFDGENRLEMKKDISGDAPQGNIVATDSALVLWAVSVQSVVVYDEDSGEKKTVEAVDPSALGDTVQSLVASKSHAVMVTSFGSVKILELETFRLYSLQDVSQVAYALPYNETLFLFSTDGTVLAIELKSRTRKWNSTLQAGILSNPILDRFGNIFITTSDGIYKVVDNATSGAISKCVSDTFSAPSFLYITDRSRLIVVSQSKIISFVSQDGGAFAKGLWFSTPFQIEIAPSLFLNRIAIPLKSGHLFLYLFGENLEQEVFVAPNSDSMNSAFVRTKGG